MDGNSTLILRFLSKLYRCTLGSVLFGIVLMVLMAIYIALGSGVPAVREYFEMNEHQFFTAWPLAVLSLVLVLNLSAVTIERIPFTPPRYGVWMIHSGIIVLVFGMMLYFKYKTEGMTFIRVGQTSSRYYDLNERSLYMRFNGIQLKHQPLPSLPRFKPAGPEWGNAARLDRKELRNIEPMVYLPDQATGQYLASPVWRQFQLPDKLEIDIVAFHPYATITSRVIDAPDATAPIIRLDVIDPHDDQPSTHHVSWTDPRRRWLGTPVGLIEHRHLPDDHLQPLLESAAHLHRLTVTIGEVSQTLDVQVGGTYAIGDTGYELTIEEFDPAFPATDGQIVPLLTMMVKSPQMQFRRQVIPGRPNPTDWKLGVEGAGPFGQRQTKPLDANLVTSYSLNDPHGLLLPRQGDHYLLVTSERRLALLSLPAKDKPASRIAEGAQIEFALGDEHGHAYQVTASRLDRAALADHVQPVPPELRRSDQAGIFQVLVARVRMGDWSQEVAVPFQEWIFENEWTGGQVRLPQTGDVLQLQLGNTSLQMPALVTLEKFELVNYPGGTPQTANLFRDFKSTITITDRETGESRQAVVHMNNPVYFGGLGDSEWTLFQARFDRENQSFTVLGVGNRPGVWVMTAGCTLMVIGLLWAFYLKPVIIQRMKERALKQAAQRRPKADAATPTAEDQEPAVSASS